jgi:hypothetical protein
MKKEGIKFQKETDNSNRDLILDYEDIDMADNASEDIMEITIDPKVKFPKEFNENLTEVFNESLAEEGKTRQQRYVTRTRTARTQRVNKIKKETIDHKQNENEGLEMENVVEKNQELEKTDNLEHTVTQENKQEKIQEKPQEKNLEKKTERTKERTQFTASNITIVNMGDDTKENRLEKEGGNDMEADLLAVENDGLLQQIDEFREKAKMLQTLIQTKENQAKKLEGIVAEKEDKAEKLQQIVNERQEKVDGITGEVNKRIKEMERELVEKINVIEETIDSRLKENTSNTNEMNNQLKETVTDSNTQALKKIDEKLGTVVTSREIEGIVEEQLEETKIVLSEKIHSEDVKLYRNTKDALKDIEQQLYNIENVKDSTNSVKGLLKAVMALSLINFAGIVAIGLYMLGFIHLS